MDDEKSFNLQMYFFGGDADINVTVDDDGKLRSNQRWWILPERGTAGCSAGFRGKQLAGNREISQEI